MIINIKRTDAEQALLKAYRERCLKSDDICHKIKDVLSGTHKTYKYILLTGLLAKSTNNNANPIALQAGAPLNGAYDARSLCHNVIVPFERDFLNRALGGSNEPFLNKPARFTHLSDKNAVRKGNDKETLLTLIYIFGKIRNSQEAIEYLSCALEMLHVRITELKNLDDTHIKYSPTLIEIFEFIINFLEMPFEGETCTIVVGTLERLYYKKQSETYSVAVHNVNQSGASSKEIGDIDIYKGNKYLYSIEVKDKTFTEYDVEHAFNKIIKEKGKKGEFIYGPRANYDYKSVESKLKEFEEKGFYTLLHDIFSYTKYCLFKIDIDNKNEFLNALIQVATEINCKEATKKWIQDLLVKLKWK